MKRWNRIRKIMTAGIAVLLLTLTGISGVQAAKTPDHQIPIDIMINHHYIRTDANPYIRENITYVPVRFIAEALRATVTWDSASSTAVIQNGGKIIKLQEGSAYATVNGSRVPLNGSVHVMQNRTYVPVRFVAEQLGASVDWDQQFFTVKIQKSGVTVPQNMIHYDYNEDEIFWMARIIEAESRGEPTEGMVAVGNVILNRVASNDYPNTIYGVIFDRKYGVQYEPTINGSIYNNPSSDSYASAKRALRGENYAGESLFFFNPQTAQNNWISKNRPYYTTIGNHDFYL